MKQAEIRARLEKEQGEPFAEATWKRIIGREFLKEYREGQLNWQDLKELADEEQDYVRALAQEGALGERRANNTKKGSQERKSPKPHFENVNVKPPEMSQRETLHAEVFEECLAGIAADDPTVQNFRQKVLGGKLLTSEQASELIRSPAAWFLPLRRFEALEIPVLGHRAELKNYEFNVPEDGSKRDRATIFIDPPGETLQLWSRAKSDQRTVMFEFVDEKEHAADQFAVWPGSLLGELHEVSEHLADRFSWQQAQATWFVLTGYIPAAPAVDVRYTLEEDERFRRGVITLTLAPWVSAETATRVYQDVQRRVLGGKHNRQPETKNLKLLRFVVERTNLAELTRSERGKLGKQLVNTWDQENRHWAYGKYQQPTSVFWRDFDNARKVVMNPAHKRPTELQSDEGR